METEYFGEELLWEAYSNSRSAEDRNRITEAYLRLAAMVAKRFSGKGVEYDDLYQVASLALLKAVERFDHTRGTKFSTFAIPTMVGEVKNYYRDHAHLLRLPRRSADQLRLVEQTRHALEQEHFRSPTLEEIAIRAEISLEEVVETLALDNSRTILSIDADVANEDGVNLAALLGAEDAGFSEVEARETIRSAVEGLSPVEIQCIRHRFYDHKNQRETAEILGVSQMTVSRMERRILQYLREAVNGNVPPNNTGKERN